MRSLDPGTWGSEAGAHHRVPGPACICGVRPLLLHLGARVGTLDVTLWQSGAAQEMCSPPAKQLIKFLQEQCNSLAWCPPKFLISRERPVVGAAEPQHIIIFN